MRKNLFDTYVLNNGVPVESRIAVAPLTLFSSNTDGTINAAEAKFLDQRAEHIGLYVLGATLVQEDGLTFPCQPRAISEADLPSLEARAKIVKSHGAKAILQIHHGGIKTSTTLTGSPAPGPSKAENVKEMTVSEIEELIESFARATEYAIRSGHDGVEIHGANGFILQQFYSAHTNHRKDQYGGSLENRMRFALGVVDAVCKVREKLNRTDFIIGYRLSPEEPEENGITMTETLALVDALCNKPLQYLHVSQKDFAQAARRGTGAGDSRLKLIHDRIAARMALVGVGGLVTGDDLEQAIKSGVCEFAAVGKSIMMNPSLGSMLYSGNEAGVITALDPAKPDHYGIPDPLWAMCAQGQAWLPPLKK